MVTARLLTAREAAEILRCHEKTIRRMIRRGQLPATMAAGRWLIPEDQLPTTARRLPPPPPRAAEPDDEFTAVGRSLLEASR